MIAVGNWVPIAIAAMVLAGIKGYWVHRATLRHGHPQHTHLVSTLVTITVGLLLLLYRRPMTGAPGHLVAFCVASGLTYSLASILGAAALQHVTLATYNSVIRLAAFLPMGIFFWLLNERPTALQWTGVLSAAVPLVLLARFSDGNDTSSSEARGIPLLLGAVVAISASHVLNKIAVSSDLRVDSISLLVGINVFAALFTLATIIVKRERVAVSPALWRDSILLGLLNVGSFGLYLEALSIGPAIVIIPLNSLHVFVSTTLSQTFETKARRWGVGFLVLWALGSAALMVAGDLR